MSTSIIQKRRAVSPVIATVILIAVAVALGIAVAFWASGLTSSFSKYEKLGVNTQYAVALSSGGWNVTLGGQNTGSSDATITQIQINGIPYSLSSGAQQCTGQSMNNYPTFQWLNSNGCQNGKSTLSVPSGSNFAIALYLPSSNGPGGKSFSSGQTIQVTIITAAGNNYPASIVLP